MGGFVKTACEDRDKRFRSGVRVTQRQDLNLHQSSGRLEAGVDSGVPYVIDIVMEWDTDCSMGVTHQWKGGHPTVQYLFSLPM